MNIHFLASMLADKQKKGFTLVETLVAVVILTFAIAGPLSIASRSLFSSTVAREQIVAIYLAQEAIEGVRSIRDQNGLNGVSWLTDLPAIGTNFTIDLVNINGGTNKPTIAACPGTCSAINYDPATRLYQYGSGSASNFTRTVRIDSVPDKTDEVKVSVTVTWEVGQVSRSFIARDNLFNWQ